MEVTFLQLWVGAALLLVTGLAVALTWWWRPSRPRVPGVPFAAMHRLRELPGFGLLVRARLRARTLEVIGLLLALLGVAVLASRWVGIDDDSVEMRNRDVVLCMDVSGSMQPVVDDVLATWSQLVDQLDGERLALVMFDGNAVTSFPLTDDYGYVRDALERAREQVSGQRPGGARDPLAGVRSARAGSSLVGDGVASCVQHFDRAGQHRSRTVVLATDNLVSGDPIYTLTQAVDLAVAGDVLVHGIVPRQNQPVATGELRDEARRTGGDVLVLDPESPTTSVVIAESITRQQKSKILAEARQRSYDRVAPGALLLVLGLGVATATRRRGDVA